MTVMLMMAIIISLFFQKDFKIDSNQKREKKLQSILHQNSIHVINKHE